MERAKGSAVIFGEITIETSVISGTTDVGIGTTILEVLYPTDISVQFQNDQSSISATAY